MTSSSITLSAILVFLVPGRVTCLDNGIALTPPLGWMSWLRFGCSYRCAIDPNNCISERLMKTMADLMVSQGYRDAGYRYLSIDDCWMEMTRDPVTGKLRPDAARFPSGMKALADYVHAKGLKLGIYLNIGTLTCAGYPGTHGHIEQDAQTIAEWGIDMVKFDGCYATTEDYDRDYPAMGAALNRTGRPIVYSCQWPMYSKYYGGEVNYERISTTCNMFRALTDIYYNYHSVESMIMYIATDAYNMTSYAGPGAWNDPDQVTIGNSGLSVEQERVQMAMWAMMASPILVSVDFRLVPERSKAILQNRHVLAINQDPLGRQARRTLQSGVISVWERSVTPNGSIAICFMSSAKAGTPMLVEITMDTLTNIQLDFRYDLYEVFENKFFGSFAPTQRLKVSVKPTSVVLLKAYPMSKI